MAQVDLKGFLRQHGFRHLRDKDRGATWGNGVIEVFVQKGYTGEAPKLRALMDQVREADRRKVKMRALEDQKMAKAEAKAAARPDVPQTPEEHRQAQIEIGRRQEEVPAEVHTPIVDPYEVPVERQPEPIAPSSPGGPVKTRKKFAGEERLYVYGRIKAMFDTKMTNADIARALQAEGILSPNGQPLNTTFISTTRLRWQEKPAHAERYAKIFMPRRQAPGVPVLRQPHPVVVAPTPPKQEIPRSRFELPLSVDAVLSDPEVGDGEKLLILSVFVQVPESALGVMSDDKLTAAQKIAVVNALGVRVRRPPPATPGSV